LSLPVRPPDRLADEKGHIEETMENIQAIIVPASGKINIEVLR